MENEQRTQGGYAAPGSNLTPTHGVILVIVASAATLLILGYITRH